MLKLLGLAFILVGFASLAKAQVPTSGNVFFGYSYNHTGSSAFNSSNTNGWEASLEGKVLPFVGIVADFDGHYGSQNYTILCPAAINCPTGSHDAAEHNVLFGPRVSASVGKFRPFAEALFGIGHINVQNVDSDTSFASAFGGGIDYRLLRVIAVRFQGDYVRTNLFSTTQNNVRLSTGIALHF